MPVEWRGAASALNVTFANGDNKVFVNVTRILDAELVTTKINIHHPVSSAEGAQEVLSGLNNYRKMFEYFSSLLKSALEKLR